MTALRYARQYTLAEIGTTGQARLEAARVHASVGDARASAVALAYLSRAGVGIDASGIAVDVASSEEITRIAGKPELMEAASFLAGALAATDAIAKITGAPARPVSHVPTLS
jgi:hypothetical protein